jgi:hypothetical protein
VEVTLPDTLLSIEYDSFYGTSIEELIIPPSVTKIGEAAFASMKKL